MDKTDIFLTVVLIICIFITTIFIGYQNDKNQCYKTYIETNKIVSNCEKYFKDLKIEK